MSHITRIRTRLAEREHLVSALRDLGYDPEVGDVSVRGWALTRSRAEVKIPSPRLGFDIGFVKSGDAYDAVADWSMLRGMAQKNFLQRLSQRYAYHAAKAKLEAQGFALVNEEHREDGEIHMVLRRLG